MATEFTTNMTDTFIKTTAQIVLLLIFVGIVKFISGLFSKKAPVENGEDGANNQPVESYVDTLNKEMEEAGVDNLHDLEEYKENKKRRQIS